MFKHSKILLLLIAILTAAVLLYQERAPILYAQWVLPASQDTTQSIPDGDGDRVLGQTDFTTGSAGLSATKMTSPAGLAVDQAGRLWVADLENNRVVSWPSVRDFSSGAAADMVLGQTDLNSNTKSATDATLNAPQSVTVAPDGALWVADSAHHRVLRFTPPFSTGKRADRVLGQPNFTSGLANAGQSSAGANTLFAPRGLDFDSQGQLYVADMLNHRVLRFTPPFTNSMSAGLVIGQADFTHNMANRDGGETKRNSLWSPAAVALDSSDSLYVADRDNNRVLRFDPSLENGIDAAIVLGKPDFTTAPAKYADCQDNLSSGGTLVLDASSLAEPLDLAFNLVGDLIVSDLCFHRVLIYEDPCSCDPIADYVYGQPDFTSGAANRNGQTAANSLKHPAGLLVDGAASLYVADQANNRVLAFDVGVGPPTATPTPTVTPTATDPATATATSDGATATATPTATATADGPTATATQLPSGVGDGYEGDNTCAVARGIPTNATAQEHTFHTAADQDWVRFSASAGTSYRIEVNVPTGSSADVDLELYRNCEQLPDPPQNPSFSPNVRVDFTPPQSGDIFLRLVNHDQAVAGAQVAYQLSVRALDATVPDRALIILAGRLRLSDPLQGNIHNITQAVYQLFQSNQYDRDHIQYLATDSALKGYTGAATSANLKAAITTWAAERLGTKGVLTLYLVDHGKPGLLFLDEVNGQRITPADLDAWLTELEGKVTDLKVNVIIEACEAGSFIQGNAATISKPNRLIITSTNADNDAKASKQGAYFSDHFLTGLAQGFNLYTSFFEARRIANQIYVFQEAWVEGDGDGRPNELEDAAVAASRGFNYPGTLDDPWPPHIFSVTPPTAIANFTGEVRADVRDDVKVSLVWGVVYPPDYTPPPADQELQPEVLPTFLLSDQGDNQFAGQYTGFTQAGVYRIILHAEDNDGLKARPLVIEVNAGSQVFLPIIKR